MASVDFSGFRATKRVISPVVDMTIFESHPAFRGLNNDSVERTIVNISGSRSGKVFKYLNTTCVNKTEGVGAYLPASPRFLKFSYNDRLKFSLVKKYNSNPELFYAQFWHIITTYSYSSNLPLSRGANFCNLILDLWRDVFKNKYRLYLRRLVAFKGLFKTKAINFREPKNWFNYLENEELPDSDSSCFCDSVVPNRVSRRIEVPLPKWDKSTLVFKPIVSKKRSPTLLYKLRSIIRRFRGNNNVISYKRVVKNKYLVSNLMRKVSFSNNMCQMDIPAHGDGGSSLSHEGNVLIEQESQIITGTQVAASNDWLDFVSSDTITQAPELTDRWIEFDNIEWTTTSKNSWADGGFKDWALPADAISHVNPNMCDVPNFMLFKVHAYSTYDMEVRFLVNSNKFQAGCLQAAWIYQDYCDFDNDQRTTVYTLSQTNHVRIYAGSMNEAAMYIPFKYSLSAMNNQANFRTNQINNLGRLYLNIINPLSVGDNVSKSVNISVQIRFSNARFTGMRSGNLKLQMNVAKALDDAGSMLVTKGAERLLDTILPDPNRDNPPVNLEAPYLVPTASHSWAAGTGRVDMPKLLRLDTCGQTPHPPGCRDIEPFTIDYIKRIFGLLHILKLDLMKIVDRQQLLVLPVEPMFGKLFKSYREGMEVTSSYAMPPLSVLSSCFAYWRGEIDVQLDIVCSQFHTFKMLVCYIPNPPVDDSVVTLAQAQRSPHLIFSVEGPKVVIVRIPYITNQRWWPRTYTGNYSTVSAMAPSKFYVFINNKILKQDSASTDIFVNIYVRGGDSFELAVPVQPSIGLRSNLLVYIDDDFLPINMKFDDDYTILPAKYNGGNFYTFVYGTGDKEFTLLSYESKPEFKRSIDAKPNIERVIRIATFKYSWDAFNWDNGNGWSPFDQSLMVYKERPHYFVPMTVSASGGPDFTLLFMAKSEKDAYILADQVQHFGKDMADLKDRKEWATDLTWSSGDGRYGAQWTEYCRLATTGLSVNMFQWAGSLRSTDPQNEGGYWFTPHRGEKYPIFKKDDKTGVIVEIYSKTYAQVIEMEPSHLQGGEREAPAGVPVKVLSMGRTLRTTGFGKIDFGENFNDLLVLCRRYQLYARISIDPKFINNYDKCAFMFTVNPQGLGHDAYVNNSVVNYTTNRCRDGIIPILLSGFRYFRGGIRIRMVFPACKNTLIWVQHRPDRPSRPRKVHLCSSVESGQSVFNHGYASELQLANINSVLEFEVPFYQYDHYGLLQTPNDTGACFDYQYGLGQICVGIKASPDDLKAFTNKNVDIYYALADDFSPSVFYGFPKMILLDDLPSDVNNPNVSKFTSNICQMMGIIDKITNKVNNSVDNTVNNVVDTSVEKVSQKLDSCIAEVKSELQNTNTPDRSGMLSLLNIISNLVHAVLNASISSICVSVFSIMSSIGIFVFDKASKAFDVLMRVVKRLAGGATKATDKPGSGNRAQGPECSQEEREEVASWVSCLFGAIASLFAAASARAAPKGERLKDFMKNFQFGLRGANALFTFVKNSLQCVKKIFYYCLNWFCPQYKCLQSLTLDSGVMSDWLQEALYLVDSKTYNARYSEKMYVDRLFSVYDFGCIFIDEFVKNKVETKVLAQLNKLFNRVCEIRAELINMGENPHVRKEPFGVYVYGDPGIGKSKLRETVCIEMLKDINYKFTSSDVFCVVNASDKHWNQCRGQPVLVIDDLWNIQTGELLYQQINMIFQIFSPVILCPPKAALEDKSMRYNPNIVWMNSNYSKLSVNGVDDDAVNRRRNILVKAVSYRSDSEVFYKKDCPHCWDGVPLAEVPPKYLQDFHHMRFFIHSDPLDANDADLGPMLTYVELVNYLTTKYNQFNKFESEKFQNSVKLYQDLVEKDCLDHVFDKNDGDETTFAKRYIKRKQAADALHKEQFEAYKKSYLQRAHDSMKSTLDATLEGNFKCALPSFIHKHYPCKNIECEYFVPDNKCQMDEAGPSYTDKPQPIFMSDYEKDYCKSIGMHIETDSKGRVIETIKEVLTPKDAYLKLTRNTLFALYLKTPQFLKFIDVKKLMDSNDAQEPYKSFLRCVVIGHKIGIFTDKCVKLLHDQLIIVNNGNDDPINIFTVLTTQFEGFGSYCMRQGRVFDNVIDFLNIRNHENYNHIKSCKHFQLNSSNLKDCVVINRQLVLGEFVVTAECCKKDYCVWASPGYQSIIMSTWINSDYVYNKAYRLRDYDMLPEYFDNGKCSVVTDIFHRIKLWLQDKWKSFVAPGVIQIFNFFKNHLPYVMGILMLGTGIYTCVKQSAAIDKTVNIFEGKCEIIESANRWTNAQSVYAPADVKATKNSNHVKVQGQQVESVEAIVQRNMFYLIWHDVKTGIINKYRCFSIGGHVGVGLRHYLENMNYQFNREPSRYKLSIEYMNKKGHDLKSTLFPLNFDAFRQSCKLSNKSKIIHLDIDAPTSNLVVFLLPKQIPEFKSMLHFFAKESELMAVGHRGLFVFGDAPTREIDLEYEEVRHGLGQYIPRYEKDGVYTGPIHLINWWKYDLQKPGYCGSLVLCPSLERPIVGIHVGGNSESNFGFAEIVCYESFNTNPYANDKPYEFCAVPDLLQDEESQIRLQGPLTVVGYVSKQEAHYQPRDTKIVPSLYQGMYPVETAPNPLSPRDSRLAALPGERDPLTLGVLKHGLFVDDFPEEHVTRAFNHLKSKILSEVKRIVHHRVISDQVAVCGHPDVPEFEALAWGTSAGYPLSQHKPCGESGKQWLFNLARTPSGYELDVKFPYHPKLASLLGEQRMQRRANIKPFTVFTDCLKDTCLSMEKCSIPGKTRIFSISPVQFTIEYRKYFQVFMGSYRRHRIVNESAIGINPDSMQWTQLHNYLCEVGDKFVVGDYSNFGPGLNLNVAYKAAQIMVEWNKLWNFSEEDLKTCDILQCELLFRYHLCNNIIYYPPAGSPSGGPSTDIINTLVNCIYIRCAWLGLTNNTLLEFDRKVRLVCYGDDLIMCIADDVIDDFNGITISRYFKQFGIKFTDVDKTGDPIKFKTLGECNFIKRSFVSHPMRSKVFLAPVDIKSVHSCLNWVHKSLPPRQAMAANLLFAKELLYGHGPIVYEVYFRQLVIKFCIKRVNFAPTPWEELDARNFEDISRGDFSRRLKYLTLESEIDEQSSLALESEDNFISNKIVMDLALIK
ncbi:polyprotein [Lycorma delicatula iflavirus 1]|nr:polyprotein [Lycorma delicatula iflavirus 1]